MTRAGKMNTYKDYRRILERKDVDAVLITTPDHWHAPMSDRSLPGGEGLLCREAHLQRRRAGQADGGCRHQVQTRDAGGPWQRSQKHFLECVKMIQDGYIGQVTHILIPHQGSYTAAPQAPATPPDTWTGKCARVRPRATRTNPAASSSAPTTTIAGESSRIRACTLWIPPTTHQQRYAGAAADQRGGADTRRWRSRPRADPGLGPGGVDNTRSTRLRSST